MTPSVLHGSLLPSVVFLRSAIYSSRILLRVQIDREQYGVSFRLSLSSTSLQRRFYDFERPTGFTNSAFYPLSELSQLLCYNASWPRRSRRRAATRRTGLQSSFTSPPTRRCARTNPYRQSRVRAHGSSPRLAAAADYEATGELCRSCGGRAGQ